jgi:fructose-1,6-bisphosphatase II
MAVMAMMDEHQRIDMLMGIGGAPEGVVTACAARALGGDMQGRLWQPDVPISHPLLRLDDLCRSEQTFFAATGVTDGELLEGVTYVRGFAHTQSIVISSYTGSVRRLNSRHLQRSEGVYDERIDRSAQPSAYAGSAGYGNFGDRREYGHLQQTL